jgi:hypothetical protein
MTKGGRDRDITLVKLGCSEQGIQDNHRRINDEIFEADIAPVG